MSVAEAKQQIRKRMDFGIEHKPDYKEPWIAKAVLESYLTTRNFSWKVIKQAFEELVTEQVIYTPSSHYYAYVPESKAKKTARSEDLLNEIRRLTKEQGMAHITKDLGIPTDVHGEIQQPIAKETLAKLARSGIIYSPRPSYYAVTEPDEAEKPTPFVRPPSMRRGPPGKTFRETGWTDNYEQGTDTPDHPFIGKFVKDPIRGDTGYIIGRRETPLGPVVRVEFRYPEKKDAKAGDVLGDICWLWEDEVEVIPKPPEPKMVIEDLTFVRAVGREKTPHEEVRGLLPEAKRLKDLLPDSPFKSDFTTQILGLEAGLLRREIVRVEMENLKEAMKQAHGRISRISETPLQRRAREALKDVKERRKEKEQGR